MWSRNETPQPTLASRQLIAGATADIQALAAESAFPVADYARRQGQRLAYDLDYVDEFAGRRIVECGAFPFLLTLAMKRQGRDAVAVDLNPSRLSAVVDRCKLEVQACDIEKQPLPFESQSVDAVIFNELFEHLRIDLIFTMSEVLRVLKPGGVLLLSTPNLASLGGLRNLLVRGYSFSCARLIYAEYEKLSTFGHMGHVREYTKNDLVAFLLSVGFTVQGIIYRGGYKKRSWRLCTKAVPALRPFMSLVGSRGIN